MISESLTTLSKSITDLRALQRYMVEVMELQQSEPALKTFGSAARLIDEIVSALRLQIENLDREIATIPGSRAKLQGATATMASAFLGFLTKTRSHELAQILRDDCTLLHHASLHCLFLQTVATAMGRTALFEVACAHQREIDSMLSDLTALAAQHVRRETLESVRQEQRSAEAAIADDATLLVNHSSLSALI